MDRLEQITERLRQQEPRVKDEDAFVDSIMERLPATGPMTPAWLRMLRTVSTMAASFLMLLYIWQQADAATGDAVPPQNSMVQSTIPVSAGPDITTEPHDKESAREAVGRYLAEREKRKEQRKQLIRHNYARL